MVRVTEKGFVVVDALGRGYWHCDVVGLGVVSVAGIVDLVTCYVMTIVAVGGVEIVVLATGSS